MTLRMAVFNSCFCSANFAVIPARYTRAPATTTSETEYGKNEQRATRRKKATMHLTLEVLQQLGIALAQLHHLLGDLLKLVGDLGDPGFSLPNRSTEPPVTGFGKPVGKPR
jgi:hypothetical protein